AAPKSRLSSTLSPAPSGASAERLDQHKRRDHQGEETGLAVLPMRGVGFGRTDELPPTTPGLHLVRLVLGEGPPHLDEVERGIHPDEGPAGEVRLEIGPVHLPGVLLEALLRRGPLAAEHAVAHGFGLRAHERAEGVLPTASWVKSK